MAQASRDQNFVTTLLGVSSVDLVTPVRLVADPTTGRLLVDSSGGAGSVLALEIPTGTVNGSNTVFTVANTPMFMDVSGQVMVSSTQDPTQYGYTYASGTVTFVDPPTQTPHSFYNNGSAGSALASLFQTDNFSATNNQTAFTTSQNVAFLLSLAVNGQIYDSTQYSFNSTNTYTLNSGVPAGTEVVITYIHS